MVSNSNKHLYQFPINYFTDDEGDSSKSDDELSEEEIPSKVKK